MVGHGASEAPPGPEHYTAEALLEDKLALFRETCRGRRTVLVAHACVYPLYRHDVVLFFSLKNWRKERDSCNARTLRCLRTDHDRYSNRLLRGTRLVISIGRGMLGITVALSSVIYIIFPINCDASFIPHFLFFSSVPSLASSSPLPPSFPLALHSIARILLTWLAGPFSFSKPNVSPRLLLLPFLFLLPCSLPSPDTARR